MSSAGCTAEGGERNPLEMRTSNRWSIFILSFALVVITLGSGMVIPIFPFYIERLGGGGRELGLLIATAAFMEFIFAPLWGSISDRTGRKPILIIGVVGNALSMVLFGLSTELWMLFAARGLAGVLSSATMPTSMAYVGDVTSDEDRGSGMGILGSAMGLGVILGPGLGGLLATGSLSTPFFIAAGLSICSFLFVALLLPESLQGSQLRSDVKIQMVRLGELWSVLFSPTGGLFFIGFLLSFGLSNFDSIFGLYALEKFGYGPQRVGTILMVMAIVTTVGKGLLTGPTTRRLGEAAVIKLSMLAGSIGFVVLLMANTYIAVLLATGFFILSRTLLRPSVLSLTSKQTTLGQGVAMGMCNSFMSLGRIAGPLWAGFVFDIDLKYPYISGSAILFIGFLISLVWGLRDMNKTNKISRIEL